MNIIRPLNRTSSAEIELVAQRMRYTLEEVLGEETGHSMYEMDWLINRVQQHINGELEAEVFVAEDESHYVVAHTIVRVEQAENDTFGLFSTIYVEPTYRRQSIASRLIEQGERWMTRKGLKKFATYTSVTNQKLINLFQRHAYEIVFTDHEKKMVVIEKAIP